jgi:extracellular elastinolytic metalloproteinase
VVDRANTPPPPPNNQPPTCSFLDQVHNAEAAGAAGVVIVQNSDANPPILSGSMVAAPPGIPAVAVSQADGDAIKGALPGSGTLRRNPAHPGIRDGDFENGIIFHEYGHGLSNP